MCHCLDLVRTWCLPHDADKYTVMDRGVEAADRETLGERLADRVERNRSPSIHRSWPAVAINFSKNDRDVTRQCAEAFEAAGLEIWPSTAELDDENSTIDDDAPQALFQCRVYIALLSESSVKDELFSDRTSLAYVYNKSIQPVGLASPSELKKSMSGGLKLVVLAINWLRVRNMDEIPKLFGELVDKVKEVLAELNETDKMEDGKIFDDEENPHKASSLKAKVESMNRYGDTDGFWERKFPGQSTVVSEAFTEAFRSEYSDSVIQDFGEEWEGKILSILERDIIQKNESIEKSTYDEFVGQTDRGDLFYNIFKDYAVGTLTMRNILGMESSVRLTVIQNMGRFNTPYVIKQLVNMLKDEDPNVRAVAALALGKSQKDQIHFVSKSLLDLLKSSRAKDRLVRESTVLALGQLRVRNAFETLSHLWRNDPIKDVREAADIALDKIGGPDVEHLRFVTDKLNEQVVYLRPSA